MSKPVQYVAAPTHVREVSLRGSADLSFWKHRLTPYDLIPVQRDGRTQIFIVAANMTYMGVRFTELSFSVQVVASEHTGQPNAAFLIHAFNTSRMFAFCERAFFGTPYYYGDCRVSTSVPVSIQLFDGIQPIFHAEKRDSPTASREPLRTVIDNWEGPIFLPKKPNAPTNNRYMFFGKMEGHATVYSFLRELDTVSIAPTTPRIRVLQDLLDSGFVGEEWLVREDGTHARSKTYPRP